ncbi:MAG: nuclear transport factor 2 family protein [Phormidium sp.]
MTTTMFPGTRSAIIKEVIGLMEKMDLEKVLTHFTEDAVYYYANNPPAVGKQAIREATTSLNLESVKAISFNIKSLWENVEVVICELEINYFLNDGSVLTLPCTDIFRMAGDKIREMAVYIDANPLSAAPEKKEETLIDIAKSLMASVESNNVDKYLSYFTEDSAYIIGNNPPIIGKQAINDFALPIMVNFSKVYHEVHDMWLLGEDTVVAELDVTYLRKDGKMFKFPCMNIIRFQDKKVREYQAFIDANPAFS